MKNRVMPYIGTAILSLFFMGTDPAMASESKKVITGFEAFDPKDHYLEIDYHVRPEEESLKKMMPESLMVHVKGEDHVLSVPVDWTLFGDSIEDTEYYYVEYRPVFDSSYVFDQEIAVEAKMPYVAVFLRENESTYEDASMADRVVASKNASARKTSYTSSPYEGKIFDYLHNNLGYNSAVCCGIMANLYAESGFYPNNLQNSGNSALGMTDEEYTRGVDNGTYKNFVNDGRGYGLCQWTYSSRKQGLLDAAISKGVSIADYKMQLAFMKKELAGYKTLVSYINDANNT